MILKSKSNVLPFGFISLGIAAFFYMKRETGKRYKIPISKIKNIQISENQAKIIFLNEANSEDFEILNDVEIKGIEIMSKLYQ